MVQTSQCNKPNGKRKWRQHVMTSITCLLVAVSRIIFKTFILFPGSLRTAIRPPLPAAEAGKQLPNDQRHRDNKIRQTE